MIEKMLDSSMMGSKKESKMNDKKTEKPQKSDGIKKSDLSKKAEPQKNNKK
jgi:hypothetical protein